MRRGVKQRLGCATRWAMSALLAGAVALALGGCAAPGVRYYSLAGIPPGAAPLTAPVGPGIGAAAGTGTGTGAKPAGTPALYFEIAPVGVPERLARPQMVVRTESRDERDSATTQVEVFEQQRWASSFDSELRDAFAAAVAARSGGIDVTRGGRLPGEPVFRIAISVRHFEAILDRQVDAGFGWTITRSDDTRNAVCQVSVSQPVGRGIDELVQGVQQSVAVAADRIAGQLEQLKARGAAACEPAARAGDQRSENSAQLPGHCGLDWFGPPFAGSSLGASVNMRSSATLPCVASHWRTT